ncbi:MAG: hypothetical protein OET79_08520, partial [Nitrospirota bacterium]|nr:hypothetical protein [Nitrospirota bacterium]
VVPERGSHEVIGVCRGRDAIGLRGRGGGRNRTRPGLDGAGAGPGSASRRLACRQDEGKRSEEGRKRGWHGVG